MYEYAIRALLVEGSSVCMECETPCVVQDDGPEGRRWYRCPVCAPEVCDAD